MENIHSLEKIIKYQQNKDPLYPCQEHLLIQLCIRANKKIQDNISRMLGGYGINYSTYMVLTVLSTADNHCLSPSEISRELQFTRTNITAAAGSNMTFSPSQNGTSLDLQAGLEARVRENITLGVQAGYAHSVSGSSAEGYNGQATLNVTF